MKDTILNLLAYVFWGWCLYKVFGGIAIHRYEQKKELEKEK